MAGWAAGQLDVEYVWRRVSGNASRYVCAVCVDICEDDCADIMSTCEWRGEFVGGWVGGRVGQLYEGWQAGGYRRFV